MQTAGRVGVAMRSARRNSHMESEEVAKLLCITPAELFEYECGTSPVPIDIFQHVFVMGYKQMHAKVLENKYRRQRNVFKKLKQTIATV